MTVKEHFELRPWLSKAVAVTVYEPWLRTMGGVILVTKLGSNPLLSVTRGWFQLTVAEVLPFSATAFTLPGHCTEGGCVSARRAKTDSVLSVPRSGKLRMQKLNSHLVRTQSLNVLPLKPGVGQYIAIQATLTARDFFLAYFYPSGPFTCIFFQNLSRFFPVLAVANTWFLCRPAE